MCILKVLPSSAAAGLLVRGGAQVTPAALLVLRPRHSEREGQRGDEQLMKLHCIEGSSCCAVRGQNRARSSLFFSQKLSETSTVPSQNA